VQEFNNPIKGWLTERKMPMRDFELDEMRA
jgi:hypothetical protein